jgi:predicted RecA/RadA family phage recombinase
VAVAFGAKVYWDNTLKQATPTGPADAGIGMCVRAALAADAVVRVKLVMGMQ